MAVKHAESPVWSKRLYQYHLDVSYTCRVCSIEQANIQVAMRACPAWSGTEVVVIDAASQVYSKGLYQYYWECVQRGAGRQCL